MTDIQFTRYASREAFWERVAPLTGRVLDIGAKRRSGATSYVDRTGPDADYLAIDLRQDDTLDVVADGRLLPFCDNSVDTIILSEVLEHVPLHGVVDMLAEARRVLRTSGRLIVTTPVMHPLHGPHDYLRLTPEGVTTALADAGFEVDLCGFSGGYAPTLGLWLRYGGRIVGEATPLPGRTAGRLLDATVRLTGRPIDAAVRLLRGQNLVSNRSPLRSMSTATPGEPVSRSHNPTM